MTGMDGAMPDEERMGLPEMPEAPRSVQVEYGGSGRRMVVESYEDFKAKYDDCEEAGSFETQAISETPYGSEVVRWVIRKGYITDFMEVTDGLREKWRRWDEEREKAAKEQAEQMQRGGPAIIGLGGLGGLSGFGGGPGQ